MLFTQAIFALLPILALTSAAPTKRCSSSISSFNDVSNAVSSGCDITINSITVPSGKALDLSKLKSGIKVKVAGDVSFEGGKEWEGPMFIIDGKDITFDGAGHTFNGHGEKYWDGKGSNGGKTKPKFMKVKMSGQFSNLIVKNAPVQTFSIGNKEPLLLTGVTVDNRDGDKLGSDGKALGHNSDCFDVSAVGATLDKNFCYNQDDCLAINDGSGITFSNNYCSGGHGISIGSVKSGKHISDVKITGNTVVGNTNGLRIKTIAGATDGSVTGVTYSGNKVQATQYGIVIQQDYENGSPTGKPTNGIKIKDVNFVNGNTVEVQGSKAQEVYVLCGKGSCTGKWDWSGLSVSGGVKGSITGNPPITGFSL
ncbi:hypothetical protein IAU59_004323 [Kwoniella sp. CBS 9459]